MHDVFISHASEDRARTLVLVDALRQEGLDVWWDGDLRAGTTTLFEISEHLDSASCVVVCWSPSVLTKQSAHIVSEAERARSRGALIPVMLAPMQLKELPEPFDQIQTIRMVEWNGEPDHPDFRRLVDDIRRVLASAPAKHAFRGPRRALLVALADPPAATGLPPLPAAATGVRDLAEALTGPECGFEVRTLVDPDGKQLMRAVGDLLLPGTDEDLAILFVAGHVTFTPWGPFLPVHNAELEQGVEIARIRQYFLDTSKAGQILLVLDACYGETSPKDIENHLRTHLGQGKGKVLLATAGGPASAPDAWKGRTSPFTGQLLRALEDDAADVDHDVITTAEEVYQAILRGLPGVALQFCFFGASSAAMQLKRRREGQGGAAALHLLPKEQTFVDKIPAQLGRSMILFLGDGIWGSGPLSYVELASSLAARAGLVAAKNSTIAAAAEALRFLRRRAGFLAELRELLDEQAQRTRNLPRPLFDLVCELASPWFIISTTYDLELERALDAAGRPYVVVCHVLRAPGDDVGKALVVRSVNHPLGRDPRRAVAICPTSKLESELSDDDCVVYKLLGSPLLTEHPALRGRELDTVVITESDHITFLGQIEHQDTTIPSAFAFPLQTRRLLFLGFNLDIWHYRLIGHTFFRRESRLSRVSGDDDGAGPLAVREPSSTLEAQLWQQFHVEVMAMDLTKFIRALRARRQP